MHKSVSRRKMVQQAAALLIASSITPAVFAEGSNVSNEADLPTGAMLSAAESATFPVADPQPVFIPPGGGKKGKISESDVVFKLNSAQTSGQFGSLELTVPPGVLAAPPHFHKNFDEICIVLEGAVTIMVEDEVVEVAQGGWHLRPRGKVHTFWNAGKEDARVIELCSPGGHEAYMEELAMAFENGGRPDAAYMKQLSQKYDIVFRFDKLDAIIKKYGLTL